VGRGGDYPGKLGRKGLGGRLVLMEKYDNLMSRGDYLRPLYRKVLYFKTGKRVPPTDPDILPSLGNQLSLMWGRAGYSSLSELGNDVR